MTRSGQFHLFNVSHVRHLSCPGSRHDHPLPGLWYHASNSSFSLRNGPFQHLTCCSQSANPNIIPPSLNPFHGIYCCLQDISKPFSETDQYLLVLPTHHSGPARRSGPRPRGGSISAVSHLGPLFIWRPLPGVLFPPCLPGKHVLI